MAVSRSGADARGLRREIGDLAVRMHVQPGGHGDRPRTRDPIAHDQRAPLVPAKLARVAGFACKPLVAVMPPAQMKSVRGRLPANLARPAAARDAEGRPEFALILALDFDRIVGARRAAVRPIRIGVVTVHARIADHALSAQGELERARTGINRARELARTDMDAIVWAQDLSARVEHARGNLKAARDSFVLAVQGFRSRAIPWGSGNALSGMASVALATGDTAQAERLLDEAMPLLRQAGPWFLTWALYVRAIVAVRHGNSAEAIALVRESLTCIRDLQDTYAFAYTLVPLVAAAVLKGDDAWAARVLGVRDAVSERTGATVVLKMVHDLQVQSELEVRARLSPDRWDRAYTAGRQSSFDELLKEIDHVLAEG